MQSDIAAVEPSYSTQRRAMVDGQIRTFDVTDQTVLQAFGRIPRERFLPADLRTLAYSDCMLTLKSDTPGSSDRVLLQPMHLARMIQGAAVRPADRVLVVAGGTGYAACLLATLCTAVVTLESDPNRSEAAAANARDLGLTNVDAVTGPLCEGAPDGAPYAIILIPGAIETGLEDLFRQLAPNGRLVTVEVKSGESSQRAGRVVRFERVGSDISERVVFDATAPVIPEFRQRSVFVF